MKKHSVFIIFFSLSIFVYLWKLIFMRGGFILGDYSVQFYPWSMLYAESIKNLSFPFWIRYIQCGFPLMAEGQVGGFYPLHIIFYSLLPFRTAYNYVVLAHFIMAGVFTYMYASKMGACRWGGTLSAIVFCFGSAYAGCMINTATLKALAWFPLVLLLMEFYFESGRPRFVFISGVILGVQLLSGAAQVGFYAILMCGVYYISGLIVRKRLKIKSLFWGMGASLTALLIFLPQLLLTRTMSDLSFRSGADIDFALTLSLSPLNFISAVFPRPVFHGPAVYIGILTLLFLLTWLLSLKRYPELYPVLAVFFVGVFISLGRYNPLYVFLIKSLEFYDFRGPSKVIVFSIFSASILAGTGFTLFFADVNIRKKALHIFSKVLALSLTVFLVARGVLVLFKGSIITFGDRLIEKYVHGKPFHRYDIEMYMEKVRGFYDTLTRFSSLADLFMFFSIVLCVLLLAAVLYLSRVGIRGGRIIRPLAIFIILAELLVFNGYSSALGRNIGYFRSLDAQDSILIERLQQDKGLFRILPYDLGSWKLPLWMYPSFNVIYGLDSVAVYTPLASEYYREGLDALEVVDSALGYKTVQEGAITSDVNLVRALNVKYVVSPYKIQEPFLEYLMSEDGVYLYKMKKNLPRAFVSKDLTFKDIDPDIDVNILEYSSGKALLEVDIPYDGFLIFSENRYPGWQARVNDSPTVIHAFSVIQAVFLRKGNNKVQFIYCPFNSLNPGDMG